MQRPHHITPALVHSASHHSPRLYVIATDGHPLSHRPVMDEDRIDQTVKPGDEEEWTVVNADQQYHGFHIHLTAFLVTEISGVPQNEDSLRDTYSAPQPPISDRVR
jgi:FtsP/CotA-like multicopper oxidase with cupredoxin domain